MSRVACALVCASLANPLAIAQNDLSARLAEASSLECLFTVRVRSDWQGSEASAAAETAALVARFSDIDHSQGTAQAHGRVGSNYIAVRYLPGYLHLLHMIDIGPVYVTTVLAEESRDGRLMAIHTRHHFAASSYPEFRERPDMYLGDCALS